MTKDFKSIRAKDEVVSFTGTAVVMCRCGSPRPLVMAILPGMGAGCFCEACGASVSVRGVQYAETEQGARVNLDIARKDKLVTVPTGADIARINGNAKPTA